MSKLRITLPLLLLPLLVMLLALSAVPVQAADYYVSPTGNNLNPGTISLPWKTVQKGLTSLFPGDTLYVRGGTYVEKITGATIRQGTASQPITVKSYTGETPLLQGLLWLNRPSYWTLDGLKVTWDNTSTAGQHMVKMTNGIGWTIKNCEFYGAKSYACLYIYGSITGEPANWTVKSNRIHDTVPTNSTNQDHNIYVNSGLTGTGGLIERNLLWNAINGDNIKLGGSSRTSGGCRGVTVRYNTCYNGRQNIRGYGKAGDLTIEKNLLLREVGGWGNIRSYQVDLPGSIALTNAGFDSDALLENTYDPGLYPIQDGGGNVWPLDPQFYDLIDFFPQNWAAQAYGRYADAYSFTFTPTTITAGTSIMTTQVFPEWADAYDWVGFYGVGAPDNAPRFGWYGDGPGTKVRSLGIPSSTPPGQYEFRMFRAPLLSGVRLHRSAILTVQ